MSASSGSALSRMFAGVAVAAVAQQTAALNEIAAGIMTAVELDASEANERRARELVRAYVSDRALIEATKLIDAEGDPEHGIQPFRESLVFSLALTVMARLGEHAESDLGRPTDADPERVLDLLERAYALLR